MQKSQSNSRNWSLLIKQKTSSTDVAAVKDNADFKLLRYFGVASLVAFVVVAVLLGYVFRTLAIGGMIKGYESQHGNYARVIANELLEQDFWSVSRALEGKSVAQIQASPQLEAFHTEVFHLLKGTDIFKIKVYDLKGNTVYSTDLRQIGQDKSRNAGVIAGLRGLNSSKLVPQNQLSTFEGEVQNRDVVESYVPRYEPVSGKVIGVFEIYGDATGLLAEIGKRQWIMVGAAVTLLALLYLAIFIIVKKAQDRIIEQSRQREKDQQALALSEQRWKFALEGAGDGVWDWNVVADTVAVSRRGKEMIGFTEDEIGNRREEWKKRIHPDDQADTLAALQSHLKGLSPVYVSEHRLQCKDGSYKWFLDRGMVVDRSPDGKPLHMIGTHTDITERQDMQERMHHMAHFDVLTELPNRALFADRLHQAVVRARRDQTRLALMFIDLDKFKPVNDELGHQVGDWLLKEVAKRLMHCVRRESDTVARIGGDEFVVMLSDVETARDVSLLAEKICESLSQTFEIDSHMIHISSSIGIAIFPEHGADEDSLLKCADAAMYQAKEAGRNRVQLFDRSLTAIG